MTWFKSHSDFFYRKDLNECRRKVDAVLEVWDYPAIQRKIYFQAFDYFREHPHLYDGATMTEELKDIPGLNLDAMLHDYLYIALMASVSWKYQRLADKLYKKESLRRGKSSWNTGYAYFMLAAKTLFWVVWCYWNGRRIKENHKIELDRILKCLS